MKNRSNLRIELAAWAVAVVGCGGYAPRPAALAAPPEGPPIAGDLEPFRCEVAAGDDDDREAREQLAVIEALRLPAELDAVRLGRYRALGNEYVFGSKGEPCAAARDRTACEEQLAELEAAARKRPQVFAITGQEGALTLYEGEQVLSLVEPIDTPERAWLALMVREDADPYYCSDTHWSGQRPSGGGFELAMLWTKSTCRPFQRVRTVFHVTRDGAVSKLRETVVETQPERCLVIR